MNFRTNSVTVLRTPQQALGLALPVGKRILSVLQKSWVYALGALTLVVMVSYMFQMNHTSTKGFALRDAERRLERLRLTVGDLENQVATKRSIATIEERIKGMGYVDAGRVEYVSIVSEGVALR